MDHFPGRQREWMLALRLWKSGGHQGVERLGEAGLTVHVVTAAVDSHLNDHAFIVPGLGDAGDRQFGPPA